VTRPRCASVYEVYALWVAVGALALVSVFQSREIAALRARPQVTIQRVTVGRVSDVQAAVRGLTQAQLPRLEDAPEARR
jgi:hypothetical protein